MKMQLCKADRIRRRRRVSNLKTMGKTVLFFAAVMGLAELVAAAMRG